MRKEKQLKPQVLYITGPMTGIKDYNRPMFNFVARKLRRAGYEVINPAELDVAASSADLTWERCIMRDVRIIMETALVKTMGLASIPDWHKSRGASVEVFIATTVKLPVAPWQEYL